MAEATLSTGSNDPTPYLQTFAGSESVLAGTGPGWLLDFRRSGASSFKALGLPTTAHEDWRFTSLNPFTRLPFKPSLRPGTTQPTPEQVASLPLANLPGALIVFVDGHFSRALSNTASIPAPSIVCSLSEAISTRPEVVEKFLGKQTSKTENAFARLNQAFFTDGAFIEIPAGTRLETLIRIIHIQTAPHAGATSSYRNLIVVGESSSARIIEHYASLGIHPTITNAITEIHAAANCDLEVIKFQDEATDSIHLAGIYGEFHRGSRVRFHSISLGARLARNDIHTLLAGPGLECILNGLYSIRQDQLADHHMVVEHAEPNCASHEYFNGILDDRSRGVFHGRILVHPIAQKTDAKQTNKNVLLSDDATANTKPQLEIYADDVKCTHGATIGQLNEESIFYLRSRGIGLERARQMLIHAFAGEIIERIQFAPVREAIDSIVWDRLEQSPRVRAVPPA